MYVHVCMCVVYLIPVKVCAYVLSMLQAMIYFVWFYTNPNLLQWQSQWFRHGRRAMAHARRLMARGYTVEVASMPFPSECVPDCNRDTFADRDD